MSDRIVVYQLGSKFVNQRADIPEEARQVVYYTLAVGHHVGVMDCFSSLIEVPLDDFKAWLDGLPEGPGREKLEGVLRWGEIEINRSHAGILLPILPAESPVLLPEPAQVGQPESARNKLAPLLAQCLEGMLQEPAYYVMMRRRTSESVA